MGRGQSSELAAPADLARALSRKPLHLPCRFLYDPTVRLLLNIT